jgi:outer membrane receptor for ferrienterochelin and colicins
MRKGDEIDGLILRGEAGSFGWRTAQIAAGRALKHGAWSLSGSYAGMAGPAHLYFPIFDQPQTNNGIADHLDGEQAGQVFGRLTLHGVTLTGAYGHRTKDVPTAAYYTKFNYPGFETADRRGFIDAELSRTVGRTQVMLRGYIDRYHYTGHYPYETADADEVDHYTDYAIGAWAGAEARVTRELAGRQTLTAGGEWRDNFRQSQGAALNGSVADGFAITGSSYAGAVYIQDEIALHRLLRVSAGVRYDEYGDWSRVTPRAAVIVTPSVRQAFKYLYGTAFRAPNAFELDYYTNGVRDTTLRPETITSHELVWEQYTGTWLRTSVSAYRNRVSRLLALIDDPSEVHEFLFHNQGGATAKGFEAETEWRFKHVEGLGSYALQETTDRDSGVRLTNSPRHVVKLRVSTPASRSFPSVAFETHHLSSRDTLAGNVLNPVHIANLTVTAPLRKRVEIVASVRNLFGNTYADPGSEEHREDVLVQDGRTFTVGLRWRR